MLNNKGLDGWYKRVENNGWRPVSNKHLVQMNIDYYYGIEKNFHKIVFHHSKVGILQINQQQIRSNLIVFFI